MLKVKTTRKKLSFCSQNEKRDLYAMVTGQTSWAQAGRCGERMCEMKTDETETDGDKCDKCEGDGNLAGTCFLRGAGHTPTGWWYRLSIKTGQTHKRHREMHRFHHHADNERKTMKMKLARSTPSKTLTCLETVWGDGYLHHHNASPKSIWTNITNITSWEELLDK